MPTALPTSKKKLHALIASLREELSLRDEQLQCKQQLIEQRDVDLPWFRGAFKVHVRRAP